MFDPKLAIPDVFLSFLVICYGLQIWTAVLLLRKGDGGARLMLAGGIMAFIGPLTIWLFLYDLRDGNVYTQLTYYFFGVLISVSGSFIFCTGLLLHALHRRGQHRRAAELEAILATLRES